MSIGIYNNFRPAYPVQNSHVTAPANKKPTKKKFSTGEKIAMGTIAAGILTVVGALIYSAATKKTPNKTIQSGEVLADCGLLLDAFV